MDEQMLEQIQQMITTATESLRQEMTGIATGLGHKITGIDQRLTGVDERVTGLDQRLSGVDQRITGLDQEITGLAGELRQEMVAMKSELRDDIATASVTPASWRKTFSTSSNWSSRASNFSVKESRMVRPIWMQEP